MILKVYKANLISFFLLIILYILFLANYYFIVSEVFDYSGYQKNNFTINKAFMVFFITLFMIFISLFFNHSLYKMVYTVGLILLYFGQSIFYLFNDSPFILVFYLIVPLIFLFIIDKIDSGKILERLTFDMKSKHSRLLIIGLITLASLPFLKYIGTVNIKNLLLIDIYETRSELRSFERGITGYIVSPLTRVVLPFLLVYALIKRKKSLLVFSIFLILSLFLLSGAVKSIFFGAICAVFFFFGTYPKKEKNFILSLIFINLVGLITFYSNQSIIINDYLRRIMYVPPALFNIYYNYFNGNFTFFSHSKLASLIGNSDREMSVSRYIGEYVMGREGLNASTGIFVEGFISFGTIGVIIFSCVFVLLISFLRVLKFDHRFFGIFFVYIYIINTTFIETLFITHGLLFLLLFSALFFPKESNNLTDK